jgi:hypothetical protein
VVEPVVQRVNGVTNSKRLPQVAVVERIVKKTNKKKRRHIDRSTSTGSTSSSSSSSSSTVVTQTLPPHLCKFLASLMQRHDNCSNSSLFATPCDLPKTPLAPAILKSADKVLDNQAHLKLSNQFPDYPIGDAVALAHEEVLEETALMDTSEDPCLNDGHLLLTRRDSSFEADEQVHKWLDICCGDAAENSI